jgi:integrase
VEGEQLLDALISAGFSNKTIACYLPYIRRSRIWCEARDYSIDTVSATTLREYSETLPFTRSSRAILRASLNAYWSAIGRPDGPALAIRVPKKPKMRCRALDEDVAAVLARAARRRGDHKGLAVLIGLYAALRRNEIGTLRWSQIGDDGWVTIVGKGDVTRYVPLHPAILEALKSCAVSPTLSPGARLQGLEWVFPGRWGGPVNPTTLWGWIRDVATEAGIGNIKPHVLRHTALATALDNTRDLRAVQEFAGHARPETTAGYTRVRRDRLVEVVTAIEYGLEESA